jgi:hypothetical protein
MALEGLLQIRERVIASEDLSGAQHTFVTLAGAQAGAGELGFPLVDKPNDTEEGTVVLVGKAKVISAGTLSAGDALASDASGHAVAAATGDEICGIALEDSVDNDVFMFLVNPQGIL